ncbi:MAG: M24 family metallopeptidase [Planctomycetes bacterium]|nr:M24 family metallopeptidase [Planctomycetota bacterium]
MIRKRRRPSAAPARRRRLVRRFAAAGIDALLVTDPANVRYLSGFRGEDSSLLVGRDWSVLLTDSRFAQQAKIDCPDLDPHIRSGPMAEAVKVVLRRHQARRVGVEAEHVTLAFRDRLTEQISARRLRQTRQLVSDLRLTKDAEELAGIRKAIRIAEEAFRGLIAGGAAGLLGRREVEVAGELDYRMRQLGAEAASFPTIVAAGPHAALPHYLPGASRLRCGQAVLVDWGALASGYCSDLTRVVFLGRIPPQLGRIYEVVLRAQAAGIAAVRAGCSVKSVDAAARNLIADAGLAEYFGHGLGHGIGLKVHEGPVISRLGEGRLRSSSVVTIEPGIYLPGVGGVRIEDDVLVQTGRAKVLSGLQKDLQAMLLE